MKNSTYIKVVRGEAEELDKRILIRDVGYEIIVTAKGYQLEDKTGSGQNIEKNFEDVNQIVEHLMPRFEEEFGDSLTQDQKDALTFESKLQIIVAGIIQDKDTFHVVRTIASETGTSLIASYTDDIERDGFQVSVQLINDLRGLMSNEVMVKDLGKDKMGDLLKELLEAERKSLSTIDVRLP